MFLGFKCGVNLLKIVGCCQYIDMYGVQNNLDNKDTNLLKCYGSCMEPNLGMYNLTIRI